MFGKNAKVDLELNRDVEQLIKTGGKEKILPIVQAGEPVLRQRTVAYNGQLSKRTLAKLIDTMHTTMLEAPGVGLAATQIGLGLALAVVEDHVRDDEDDPREIAEFPFHVIINPSYRPTSDKTASFYEGCLSLTDTKPCASVGSTSPPNGMMKTANTTASRCTAGPHASSSTKPII